MFIYIHLEGKRKRTEPAEPNRTEPFNSDLEPAGTGRGTEPNRQTPAPQARFGAPKASIPAGVALRRSVFFTDSRTSPARRGSLYY